jgi:hypothetical protein
MRIKTTYFVCLTFVDSIVHNQEVHGAPCAIHGDDPRGREVSALRRSSGIDGEHTHATSRGKSFDTGLSSSTTIVTLSPSWMWRPVVVFPNPRFTMGNVGRVHVLASPMNSEQLAEQPSLSAGVSIVTLLRRRPRSIPHTREQPQRPQQGRASKSARLGASAVASGCLSSLLLGVFALAATASAAAAWAA